MNLQAIKEAAQQIKDKLTKSPLEQTLSESTSNENWNTPTKLLQELAEASYGYTSCDIIMKFIWKRLDSDNREWRRILKTLNIIEYLIKNGAPHCVGEFRNNISKIRSFSDFFLVDQGSDKGLSIRDKTKQLVDLLSNENLIIEERESAKKIRERLAAAGGVGAIGSNTSYQGYGSSSYESNKPKVYGQESNSSQQTSYSTNYGGLESGGGLDKYKGITNNNTNNQTNTNNTHTNNQTNTNITLNEIQWTTTQLQTVAAPFSEPVMKLAKPGEKWDVPEPKIQQQQQPQQTQQQQSQSKNLLDIFDVPQQVPLITQQQPLIAQPLQPAPSQQQNNQNEWGAFQTATPINNTIQQQQTQQQVQHNLLPNDIFTPSVPQSQSSAIFGQQILPQQNNQQQQFYQQQPQQLLNQQPQAQQNLQSLYSLQQQQNNLYQNYQINNNYQQQQQQQQQAVSYPKTQVHVTNNNQQKQQQDDFAFDEFVSATQPKINNTNQTDLLGMLDLKKEKQELEQKRQIPIASQQNMQAQLYASQSELDSFQFNYQNKVPIYGQYQYQQSR
ncbi:unnamed protein product [Paramecium sonneborni]|uniref:ENTH domain-containing protein n=1 Tax=Paramecium sonneborni TaxID=65129 RepID=A0A8S1MQX5_9CILI|nr:unnamed protein product [Paramecium sonneborni]